MIKRRYPKKYIPKGLKKRNAITLKKEIDKSPAWDIDEITREEIIILFILE